MQEQKKTPDGVLCTFESGATLLLRDDGSKLQMNPDGSTLETLVDGTKIQTKDGVVVTQDAKTGDQTSKFPDGSIAVRHADGRQTQIFPNGSKVIIELDGSSEQTDPDGTVFKVAADGTIRQSSTDGRTVETSTDGTTKYIGCNGSSVEISTDGRKVVRDADGFALHIEQGSAGHGNSLVRETSPDTEEQSETAREEKISAAAGSAISAIRSLNRKSSLLASEKHGHQFPKMGVSLAVLKYLASQVSPELTTTDLCMKVVKPLTAERKCSMVDWLAGSDKGELERVGLTSDDLGDATVFVSHAWSMRFADTVEALSRYEAASGRSDWIYWFDVVSVNQNISSSYPDGWWATTFRESIKRIGHLVLVLAPWIDPKPLTRSWCLWEILSAHSQQVPIAVAMPSEEQMSFEQALLFKFESTLRVMTTVDAERAQAYLEADRAMILKAIRSAAGGVTAFNTHVKDALRQWFTAAVLKAIQERKINGEESDTDETAEAVCHLHQQAGRLLISLGRSTEAEELLREALKTLSHRLGESERVARAHMYLAECLAHQHKIDEAIEVARLAADMISRVAGASSVQASTANCNLYALILENSGVTSRPLADASEAELTLVQKAVDAYESTISNFDDADPSRLAAMNNLAGVYRFLGKVAKAAEVYGMLISAIKESPTMGPKHPQLFAVLNNMSNVCELRDDYETSVAMLEEAAAGMAEVAGTAHARTRRIKTNLGCSLLRMAEKISAQQAADRRAQVLERALAVFMELGDTAMLTSGVTGDAVDPIIIESLYGQASSLAQLGRQDEAQNLLTQVVSILDSRPETKRFANLQQQLAAE